MGSEYFRKNEAIMIFPPGTKLKIIMQVTPTSPIITYSAEVIEDSEDFIFIEEKFGDRIRIDKRKCIQIQERRE
jgi:hypothetical protein